MQKAIVDVVLLKDSTRVAVHVMASGGVDLQCIYRAALWIYWNPEAGLLEDRHHSAPSAVNSATRIARAMREEYGLALQPSAELRWEGFDDRSTDEVAAALFG